MSGKACYKEPMSLRSCKIGRWAGNVALWVALAWGPGCAAPGSAPLPPEGVLRPDTLDLAPPASAGEEQPRDVKPAKDQKSSSVRKSPKGGADLAAAPAPASAKDDRSAEVARQKAETRRAREEAAAAKAAERKARKDAARTEAEAKKTAKSEAAKAVREAAKKPEADPSGETVAKAAPGQYVLQPGDEIDIQIYREPELSGTFRIDSDGDIRHSLAGSVSMAGMTVKEAEADFTRRLAKDYLVNPRVILQIVSSQSSQIVLLGEVEKPGVYPLPGGESRTLLQAIAEAGGFTELASPDRVRIVRKTPDGKQTTLKVRVSDLLGGGRQQDVPLEPNDVIMVPEVVF